VKILAIGDIFGKLGRKIIKNHLEKIKQEHQIDLVVANVENATHGKGISYSHYKELSFTKEKKVLIDVMTSGNHVFDLEETRKDIGDASKFSKLIRPLNSNPYHGGKGSVVVECKDKKIRITNLIGRTFMPPAENPYFALEKILEEDDSDIHLVDFHAEATAEKITFAYYFDDKFPGKITAVWGTHTHVQTADERTLNHGTAFITDLGMTGPSEGIIGARPAEIIQRSQYGFSFPIRPHEEGEGQFNGLVLEIDDISNKVISLRRIIKKI
jgi:metallophosphoesterase (TIGR00282 family)